MALLRNIWFFLEFQSGNTDFLAKNREVGEILRASYSHSKTLTKNRNFGSYNKYSKHRFSTIYLRATCYFFNPCLVEALRKYFIMMME